MDRLKATFYLEKEAIQAIDAIQAHVFDLTNKKPEKSHVVRDAVLKLLETQERGEV